jgi:hypothetical protein
MWMKLFNADYRIWVALYVVAVLCLAGFGKKGMGLWVMGGMALIIGTFATVLLYFASGEFLGQIILKFTAFFVVVGAVSEGYSMVSEKFKKKR